MHVMPLLALIEFFRSDPFDSPMSHPTSMVHLLRLHVIPLVLFYCAHKSTRVNIITLVIGTFCIIPGILFGCAYRQDMSDCLLSCFKNFTDRTESYGGQVQSIMK